MHNMTDEVIAARLVFSKALCVVLFSPVPVLSRNF